MIDWRRVLKREKRAFIRIFGFQPNNSDMEKILTAGLFGIWVIITLGESFGYAEPTPVYATLTAVVWSMVGRVWGFSVAGVKNEDDEE